MLYIAIPMDAGRRCPFIPVRMWLKDVAKGTLRKILKNVDITMEEFERLR